MGKVQPLFLWLKHQLKTNIGADISISVLPTNDQYYKTFLLVTLNSVHKDS
jgi:hypothetical protein